MSDDVSRTISSVEDAARPRVAAAATLDELDALKAELLGRRSELVALRQRLGSLDPDERRIVGKALNAAIESIGSLVAERRAELDAAERRARLEAERLDLTEVRPGPRPRGSTSPRCSPAGPPATSTS